MRKRLVAAVAVLIAAAGCGSSDSPEAGDPAVIDRIESLTDCDGLQAEFDTAAANSDRAEPGSEAAKAAVAYMETANNRLQELGC